MSDGPTVLSETLEGLNLEFATAMPIDGNVRIPHINHPL